MKIPEALTRWFLQKDWTLHPYQKKMFSFYAKKQSVLLIAPTGGGKTLASFLPSLMDINAKKFKGLHTLYISPLKALTADIQRNLYEPIEEMGLAVTVDSRTGDTSSYRRTRQRKKPPTILLTTPESLMLLLSYTDAASFFSTLHTVIIDELHSFAPTKRGDLLALSLAQLTFFAPQVVRFGLSATVAEPERLAQWLGGDDQTSDILIAKTKLKPDIQLLSQSAAIPYGGFMAKYAVPEMYQTIGKNKVTLIFVNTRAQAEFIFQQLWLANEQHYPIAIYHGSLSKEQRLQTEKLMNAKQLKAVVTTSALELGIDWGDVDCVIQVGAPRGVSRLLQRIGRSNHQFNKASLAKLVPANCFDTLECQAAIDAIAKGQLDGDEFHVGSLDVVVQFIINQACSGEINPTTSFKIVRSAYPYKQLTKAIFVKLFEFATNGGYVLKHYEQYHRLQVNDNNQYIIASPKVARRHRQNIGTIIESARLYVKVMNKRKGKIVGDIEEAFAQQLSSGDTFIFAGLLLEFVRIRDMFVEARKTKGKNPKLPSYEGGTMPLSTYLAEEVRALINTPARWSALPPKVREWLSLQQQFSHLPAMTSILVEQFPFNKSQYLSLYSFEGRRANHTLGMLMTKRMETLQLKPISFTATDYGLAIRSLVAVKQEDLAQLFADNLLQDELEDWLAQSPLLKRSFRQVAIISGLIERQLAGQRKTMRQVTFSTDLIYDVLKRHEPDHILLNMTRLDASRLLLDIERLHHMLKRFQHHIVFVTLKRPSPLSIPILNTFNTENVKGEAIDAMLAQAEKEATANGLMDDIRESIKK